MRDAESMLDQLAAMTGAKIALADIEALTGGIPQKKLIDTVAAIGSRSAKAALEIVGDVLARGAAEDELIQQFIEMFRDILLAKLLGVESPLIDRTEADRAAIAELAEKFPQESLMYMVQMFAIAKQKARDSSQSRIVLELALIKASESADIRPLEEIMRRLNQLERGGGRAGGAIELAPERQARTRSQEPEPAEFNPAPPPEKTGDTWHDALNLIAQRKQGLAHLISDCSFRIEASGSRARFIIEADRLAKVQAEANKPMLEQALIEASGMPGSLEIIERVREAPAQKPASLFEPKGQHVKKAVDMFGGRIVDTIDRPASRPVDSEEG